MDSMNEVEKKIEVLMLKYYRACIETDTDKQHDALEAVKSLIQEERQGAVELMNPAIKQIKKDAVTDFASWLWNYKWANDYPIIANMLLRQKDMVTGSYFKSLEDTPAPDELGGR